MATVKPYSVAEGIESLNKSGHWVDPESPELDPHDLHVFVSGLMEDRIADIVRITGHPADAFLMSKYNWDTSRWIEAKDLNTETLEAYRLDPSTLKVEDISITEEDVKRDADTKVLLDTLVENLQLLNPTDESLLMGILAMTKDVRLGRWSLRDEERKWITDKSVGVVAELSAGVYTSPQDEVPHNVEATVSGWFVTLSKALSNVPVATAIRVKSLLDAWNTLEQDISKDDMNEARILHERYLKNQWAIDHLTELGTWSFVLDDDRADVRAELLKELKANSLMNVPEPVYKKIDDEGSELYANMCDYLNKHMNCWVHPSDRSKFDKSDSDERWELFNELVLQVKKNKDERNTPEGASKLANEAHLFSRVVTDMGRRFFTDKEWTKIKEMEGRWNGGKSMILPKEDVEFLSSLVARKRPIELDNKEFIRVFTKTLYDVMEIARLDEGGVIRGILNDGDERLEFERSLDKLIASHDFAMDWWIEGFRSLVESKNPPKIFQLSPGSDLEKKDEPKGASFYSERIANFKRPAVYSALRVLEKLFDAQMINLTSGKITCETQLTAEIQLAMFPNVTISDIEANGYTYLKHQSTTFISVFGVSTLTT